MKTSSWVLLGAAAFAAYYVSKNGLPSLLTSADLSEPAPDIGAAVAAAPTLNLTGLAAMPRRQRYSRFFTA